MRKGLSLLYDETQFIAALLYKYRSYSGEEAVGTGVGMTSSDKREDGVNQTPPSCRVTKLNRRFSKVTHEGGKECPERLRNDYPWPGQLLRRF